MDSSDPEVVPAASYKPPQFQRIALQRDFVALGAERDSRLGPVGAALTRDGEVWTWGKALGKYTPDNRLLQSISRIISRGGLKVALGDPKPITRQEPWQLRNLAQDDTAAK